MFYAAQAGRAEVVRKLLAARANTEVAVKEPYEGYVTPLVAAAEEGHLEVVRALLKAGANVSHRSRSGKTALTAAAQNGHTEVVGVLVDAFKKIRKDLRLLDTALWWAVVLGNVATVELLLSAGASPHATSMFEGRIYSALQMAKKQRSKSKLRLLEAALKTPQPARKGVTKGL